MSVSFTVSQAAQACGVSRKTITRRLSALADHGAEKDPSGAWSIPVGALIAVGLNPGKPTGPDEQPAQPAGLVSIPVSEYEALRSAQGRADRLAGELEAVRQQATERAQHIEDLRLALRALEPAPGTAEQQQPTETPRRWWQRKTG